MSERVTNDQLLVWLNFIEHGNSLTVQEAEDVVRDLLDARVETEKLANGVVGLSADVLRLKRELAEAHKGLGQLFDLATTLTAEVTVEWSNHAKNLCDMINAFAAARAAGEER